MVNVLKSLVVGLRVWAKGDMVKHHEECVMTNAKTGEHICNVRVIQVKGKTIAILFRASEDIKINRRYYSQEEVDQMYKEYRENEANK